MTELLRAGWQNANDRFKESFGRVFGAGLIVAAVAHFALFQFFPSLEAEDWTGPEVFVPEAPPPPPDLPPPPEEIDRPAPPVPSEMDIEDVPPATTLEANPVDLLPPPPEEIREGERGGGFMPYTVKPEIRDPAAALREVRSAYPKVLKQAGIGGSVLVRARIDTAGRVTDARIARSSGTALLDEAALQAIQRFQFTPALNRDKRVPVWIVQRIVFRTR